MKLEQNQTISSEILDWSVVIVYTVYPGVPVPQK